MNAYFLEDLISSTTLILIFMIGILVFVVIYENFVRGKVEQQLHQSQNDTEVLQKLFLNMRVPYLVINENGIITNVNNAATRLFDKTREEMIGEPLDPFFIIKSSPIESGKLKKSVENNETFDFDSSIRANNEIIECVFQITGVVQDGLTKYLIRIITVDPKEKTEHDNNVRDERINRLEEITDVGYFVFEHENDHTRWSRGLYKLLGAEINATEPSLNFISQIDTTNEELQNIILSIQKMKPYSNKIKINGYDGITRWVQLDITHQEGIVGDNATLGILKLINSVKTSLDEYIIASNDLDLLDNPSFFQLILIGPDGKIQEANRAFLDYLGLKREEVIGKDIQSVFEGHSIKFLPQEGTNSVLVDNGDDLIFIKKLAIDCGAGISLNIALPVNLKSMGNN